MYLKRKTIFQAIIIVLCCLLYFLPGTSKAFALTANTIPYQIAVPVVVIVQPGDTLSSLADQYDLTWQGLYCTNREIIGPDPNLLVPGEELTMEDTPCMQTEQENPSTTQEYTISGTPQQIAWTLLSSYSDQSTEFSCLNNIIMSESSWSVTAYNPSGAYGIPQALPGSKMAGPWGYNWETSAYVQLYWMIKIYIPSTYGTPCNAWAFHLANGWY